MRPPSLPSALAALDADTARQLLAQSRVVQLDSGRYVFNLGDTCEAFLVVLDGKVRVQLTSAAGREVTLYRVGPGSSCLLTTSCLFSSDLYPAEAVAETAVRALAVPVNVFRNLLGTSADFREYVFDGFARRLADVILRIEALALAPIDGRLARALLEMHQGGAVEVTHQQLAGELGTAREVVSRHLKRMENNGLVELGRGWVRVKDPAALDRIAALAAV
jgi:CRP/FNR family transcriptional regulator